MAKYFIILKSYFVKFPTFFINYHLVICIFYKSDLSSLNLCIQGDDFWLYLTL